ncbi:hypothetical protein TYRP_015472 [Tyrophagus putrescentiae]|nr:hypothetical protein TYRP_015472 [Tyrophagus putrescentiae]
MPNLKTIYINYFKCVSCKVELEVCRGDSSLLSSPPALGCFRSSLFNLHLGVPMKRFILQSGEERLSAEKLLLQNPSDSMALPKLRIFQSRILSLHRRHLVTRKHTDD